MLRPELPQSSSTSNARLSGLGNWQGSTLVQREQLDHFEWQLELHSLQAVAVFFVLAQLSEFTLLWLPWLPRPSNLLASESLFLTGSILAMIVLTISRSQFLPIGSPRLHGLSLGFVFLEFALTITQFALFNPDLLIAQGMYIVISTFFLFLISYFSRGPLPTLVFGVLLLLVAGLLFLLDGPGFFPTISTRAEISRELTATVLIAIPAMTFIIFLLNSVVARLGRRSRQAMERLAELAYIDGETGFPNGLALERDLDAWSAGNPADQRLLLAGFRIQGLEALNRAKGIEFAGSLLARMVHRFATLLLTDNPSVAQAPLAPIYRLGADSFIFLLQPDAGGDMELENVRQILGGVILEERMSLTPNLSLRFSGGFTVFPDEGESIQILLRSLRDFLFQPPPAGRGDFLPLNVDAHRLFLRREKLKEALARALEDRSILAAFQPKLDLASGRLTGFEALARWTHPELGIVSPVEFIPLAEEHNLIDGITLRMLGLTREFLSGLDTAQSRDLRVSINLSPGLLTPDFLARLVDELESEPYAGLIDIEITEGMLMIVDPAVQAAIDRIRAAGASFSIDDFGSGYSNLGYLQGFHAENLKIDKRFIDGLPADTGNANLTRVIIQMARNFGMKVVAEGVENQDQLAFLAAEGCDQIQGFLHARPLSASDARDWVRRFNRG